jgi:hypothetical protein
MQIWLGHVIDVSSWISVYFLIFREVFRAKGLRTNSPSLPILSSPKIYVAFIQPLSDGMSTVSFILYQSGLLRAKMISFMLAKGRRHYTQLKDVYLANIRNWQVFPIAD